MPDSIFNTLAGLAALYVAAVLVAVGYVLGSAP